MASTYLESLKRRRNRIATRLEYLESGEAGDKPNSTGDGTHVDHQGYIMNLMKQLEKLDDLIRKALETEAMAEEGANDPVWTTQTMRPYP
jgi:hypothetical protein